MGKLSYFKWMIDDAEVLKENLTTEQIGELFIAVMDYLQTGTITEVSKDVRYPFADYRKKVDRAVANYDETCAKRAESGKKGGISKAKNAAKASDLIPAQTTKFTPPTFKQFKTAAEHFVKNEEIDHIDEYALEKLYSDLDESGWEIKGVSLKNRYDWESVILSSFFESDSVIAGFYYQFFCYVFSAYDGLRDTDGRSTAEEAVNNFFYDFDENNKQWIIDGQIFPISDRQAALDAYVRIWIEENNLLANASTC